jgi:hypothetical protein
MTNPTSVSSKTAKTVAALSCLALCLLAGASAVAQGSNIVANIWQTFEFDSLNATNLNANDGITGSGSWSVVGASAFSINTASEHPTPGTINSTPDAGSRGLVHNGSSTGDARVLWSFDSTSRPGALSFGFWFKVGSAFVGSFDEHDIFVARRNLGGTNYYVKLSDNGNNPRIYLFAEDKDYSPGITINPETWYWITGKWVLNTDLSLRVYNDAGVQVGTQQRYTGSANSDRIIHFAVGSWIGPTDGNTEGVLRFDDFVVDWADATYPLGPNSGGSPLPGPPTALRITAE